MSTLTLRSQIREHHLTCSICFNNFIKPKALPCLHTYCEGCLRDYVVSRGYEGSGSFPCPVCRTTIIMPETGVEGFRDNHLMLSLSDTVEMATPSRPVPKPRKSLGQLQPQEAKEDQVSPPPYSSVSDTNPQATDISSSKLCANDTEPDWMVVPRQTPSAPSASEHPRASEFCVVSVTKPSSVPTPTPSGQNSITSVPSVLPSQPPSYTTNPGEVPVYPDLNTVTETNDNAFDKSTFPPGPGWNFNALGNPQYGAGVNPAGMERRDNDDRAFNTHSPPKYPASHRPISPVLYPSVPPNVEYNNVACTENLMLKFGKQGSSVRDFLKPVGLAVSKEGNYVVSDSSGDQNRIFIFNSGGELIAAFKSGCKVKDVTMTKNNEIYAAVHKSVAAIRHFTMAGQCKGEYGKFFTYEMPSGIAVLKNGGAVLTGIQSHCVYVLTDQMKLATKFGRKGNGDGYFQHPGFVAVDSKNHIIVTDKINNSVQVFGSDGKFKHRFGSIGNGHGSLKAPLGVCVDAEDNIIIADSENCRVEVFTSKGRWLSSVVRNTHELGEKVRPVNVAVTPTGKVAVLLRGPYFAEVRVYTSRHLEILHQKEGPVRLTSAVWHTSNK